MGFVLTPYCLVAGNVYTTLQTVTAVEDRLHPAFGGRFPAVLCPDVSVATKAPQRALMAPAIDRGGGILPAAAAD